MRHDSFSPNRSSTQRTRVLAQRAAAMRQAPTASEARLFEAVRGERLGVSFRRQVPLLGRFIADLFAPEVRLVVEVDGAYHTRRSSADERRDRALARAGFHVLRIEAELVMGDLPAAVARVRAVIEQLREPSAG
jgi:leucyl-tRNA synthetase